MVCLCVRVQALGYTRGGHRATVSVCSFFPIITVVSLLLATTYARKRRARRPAQWVCEPSSWLSDKSQLCVDLSKASLTQDGWRCRVWNRIGTTYLGNRGGQGDWGMGPEKQQRALVSKRLAGFTHTLFQSTEEAGMFSLRLVIALGFPNRNMAGSVATSFKCELWKWFFEIDIIFLYIL